jgi:hypothetical protein
MLVLRLTCIIPVLEQAPKNKDNHLLLYMLCIHIPNRYLIFWKIGMIADVPTQLGHVGSQEDLRTPAR